MLSSEKVAQFVVLCVCQWRNWTRSLHKNYGWYSCLLHSELLMCICFCFFYWDIIFFLMILVLYCVICLQHLHLTEAHSNIRLTLYIFTQFTSLATKLWQLVCHFVTRQCNKNTKQQYEIVLFCCFIIMTLYSPVILPIFMITFSRMVNDKQLYIMLLLKKRQGNQKQYIEEQTMH